MTEVAAASLTVPTQLPRRCQGLLARVKARWIHARTACRGHESARANKEKVRRWLNWITLALAILTTLSATLMPILGDKHTIIQWITLGIALLTSLSKVMEQLFARAEDIATHVSAMGRYRDYEDDLMSLADRIRSHLEDGGPLDYDEADVHLKALGKKIEGTRKEFPVAELTHKEQAASSFKETEIFKAYEAVTLSIQREDQHRAHFESWERRLTRPVRSVR